MYRSTVTYLARFPLIGRKHALRTIQTQARATRLISDSLFLRHENQLPISQTLTYMNKRPMFSRAFSGESQNSKTSQETEGGKKSVDSEYKQNGENGTKNAKEGETETTPESKEEALKKELEESRDHLLRALAEAENTRQRYQREMEIARQYAIQGFAKQLLDVADNLQRALESVPQEAVKAQGADNHLVSLYEGVNMTRDELMKIFRKHNIIEYGTSGEDFDPHQHEAMLQVPDPNKKPNTIAHVFKTGFKIKDRVLRPAQVSTVQANKQ